jgi:hypothetical protein
VLEVQRFTSVVAYALAVVALVGAALLSPALGAIGPFRAEAPVPAASRGAAVAADEHTAPPGVTQRVTVSTPATWNDASLHGRRVAGRMLVLVVALASWWAVATRGRRRRPPADRTGPIGPPDTWWPHRRGPPAFSSITTHLQPA